MTLASYLYNHPSGKNSYLKVIRVHISLFTRVIHSRVPRKGRKTLQRITDTIEPERGSDAIPQNCDITTTWTSEFKGK